MRCRPPLFRDLIRRLTIALAVALCLFRGWAVAREAEALDLARVPDDLTQLSLDDLMLIEVTTVSRRAEPLNTAPAAVFVLRGEEIRRSGVRTIADALRLVPGVEVARTSAQAYAVSVRGFNSTSADKLEILLDGRSVYTPFFSGVFWDVLDTYLADIDRIEVIRGPGATLWGANAVNGVINIVTSSAAETQGTQVRGGVGSEERSYAAMRAGGRAGESGHVRAYAKHYERDPSRRPDGSEAVDGVHMVRAGFRSDWQVSADDGLVVAGDVYNGVETAADLSGDPGESDVGGANLSSTWTRSLGEQSELSLQSYYDHSDRRLPEIFGEERDTVGVDFQHSLALGTAAQPRHRLVWGLNYRNSRDNTDGPPAVLVLNPESRRLQTYGAFVQDQISLAGGAGTLTLGTKFEHNDFTGAEWQPNVRLGWNLSPRSFTWASVARAVRTPNRLDSDIAVFCTDALAELGVCTPGLFRIGNPDLDSEELVAYEWGARWWTAQKLSVDLALYYNDYDRLRSTEAGGLFGRFGNTLHGTGTGGELVVSWHPGSDLTLHAFYSHLDLDLATDRGSLDVTTPRNREGNDPRHQAGLRAAWQPAARWTADAFLRYVSELRFYDSTEQHFDEVPAYSELDLRVAWRVRPGIEIALTGQNLLAPQHPEFGVERTRNEVQRAGLIEIIWDWQ